MEKPIEYKEMAARHIYAYHNTAGKRSISRSEKVKVSAEEATKWLDAQYGKEALVAYVIGALHDLVVYMRPNWLDNEDSSLTLDVSLDGVKCKSCGGLVTMTQKGYTFDVEG